MLAGHLQSYILVDPAEEVPPEGHVAQKLCPLPLDLYWLAGHVQCDTSVDPAEEVVPSGHDLQDDKESLFESWYVYVLAGHLQDCK